RIDQPGSERSRGLSPAGGPRLQEAIVRANDDCLDLLAREDGERLVQRGPPARLVLWQPGEVDQGVQSRADLLQTAEGVLLVAGSLGKRDVDKRVAVDEGREVARAVGAADAERSSLSGVIEWLDRGADPVGFLPVQPALTLPLAHLAHEVVDLVFHT